MNYKIIEEILIILKTNPREFHEENYDKETIDYLKEIIWINYMVEIVSI